MKRLFIFSFLCLAGLASPAATWYVDASRPDDTGDGTTWETAIQVIQTAIDKASEFDTILVAPGVYDKGSVMYSISLTPDDYNRIGIIKNITVKSRDGKETTFIRGSGTAAYNTLAAVRCVFIAAGRLEGFTLEGGTTGSRSLSQSACGGAVSSDSTRKPSHAPNPVIADCVIRNSYAPHYGGGVNGGLILTLENCEIYGNSAGKGGGVRGATLKNCIIRDNTALETKSASEGGGGARACSLYNCLIYNNTSHGLGGGTEGGSLYGCVISNNVATAQGGACFDTLNLYDCLLYNNSAGFAGGAIAGYTSGASLYNCTLYGNRAGAYGGGVYSGNQASIGTINIKLYNCIVLNNTLTSGLLSNYYNGTFSYSCTSPYVEGTGNIEADPKFVDVAAMNFRLKPDSPCVDAGNGSRNYKTYDPDGNQRTMDGNGDGVATIDIGAYELLSRYRVTFNAHGGLVSEPSILVAYSLKYGPLPEPTRPGYTFEGWFTVANGGGTRITAESQVIITQAQTLHAKWTAENYTLTLNAQGGSVTPTTQTVIFDSPYGNLPVPVKDGFVFAGWFTESEGGNKIETSTKVTAAANHTVYAHWAVITHTVTLNAQSGSVTPATFTVPQGGTYGTLPTPQRSGYVFGGWWTEPQGAGSKTTESTRVTATQNHTLYALWLKAYTLTVKTGKTTEAFEGEQIEATAPDVDNMVFEKWAVAPATANLGAGFNAKAQSTTVVMPAVNVTLTPVYLVSPGYLQITPSPTEAPGIEWSVNNKEWFAVTDAATPLKAGSYTVFFRSADPRWIAPAKQTITIRINETTTLNAVTTRVTVPVVIPLADGPGTITLSPANGQVINGKPVTLTAKPEKDALFVDWDTGEATASIKVAPAVDTLYTARFRMKADCADPVIQVASARGMVGVPFELQVEINDGAKPVKFSASGLPTGLKLNAATGLVSGVPAKAGTFNAAIKATSAANSKKIDAKSVAIAIEALPAAAQGAFNGYVENEAGICGSFTATVSATGKITAKVVSTGGALSFAAPSWSARADSLFTAEMAAKKGETLTLALDAALPWNACAMTGLFNGTAELTAQRNPFTAKNATALAELNATYKGYYTLALEGTFIEESEGQAQNIPEGHGYITATVDAKGTVKLAGKLADGAAVSGGIPMLLLDGSAVVPAFLPLYNSQGLCSGLLHAAPEGTLAGAAWQWRYPGKTPTGKTPATEDRFAMALTPSGGRYSNGADLAAHYAGLSFNAHDYAVEILPDAKGGIKLPAAKGPVYDKPTAQYIYNPQNPGAATLSVNKTTGLFTGKFNLYEENGAKLKTTSFSHQGVLLPTGGKGFYHVSETWKSGDPKPVSYPLKRSYPVSVE